jgi:hypothetical protein
MFDDSNSKRSWLFSSQVNGSMRIIFSWDGTNISLHTTPAGSVFNNVWNNVIVDFASGVFHAYVNDSAALTLNQTVAWSGGSVALFSANIQHVIHGRNPSTFKTDESCGGSVSNFSLWSKVLSAAERTEIYNNGTPKDLSTHSAVANLTNWLRMDQSDSGSTLVDSINSGANATITTSGTSGIFTQGNDYARQNTSPGAANTRSGTSWVYEGDSLTGTAAIPSAANVRSGTATDATTGTLVVPSTGNVKTGVSFDNSSTGTYDGSDRWTDPGESNTRLGTAYKANSTSNNKTGAAAIPSAANVRAGTATDATIGTLAVPAASDVRSGVSVDAGVGTCAVPDPEDVRNQIAIDDTVGTCSVPDPYDVRFGVAVDVSDSGSLRVPGPADVRNLSQVDHTLGYCFVPAASDVRSGVAVDVEQTGTCAVPSAADVRDGISVDASSGTLKVPSPSDVRDAVETDDTVGTLDLPLTSDVREDVVYDDGTKTGTLVVPQASDVRAGVTFDEDTQGTLAPVEDLMSVTVDPDEEVTITVED